MPEIIPLPTTLSFAPSTGNLSIEVEPLVFIYDSLAAASKLLLGFNKYFISSTNPVSSKIFDVLDCRFIDTAPSGSCPVFVLGSNVNLPCSLVVVVVKSSLTRLI